MLKNSNIFKNIFKVLSIEVSNIPISNRFSKPGYKNETKFSNSPRTHLRGPHSKQKHFQHGSSHEYIYNHLNRPSPPNPATPKKKTTQRNPHAQIRAKSLHPPLENRKFFPPHTAPEIPIVRHPRNIQDGWYTQDRPSGAIYSRTGSLITAPVNDTRIYVKC